MILVRSVDDVPIRLTDERWDHICRRHPEMESQRDRVLETLAAPEMVQLGDKGELLAVRFYQRTPLTRKHLVVVYRELDETDGFVITAYLTPRPAIHREMLWKR